MHNCLIAKITVSNKPIYVNGMISLKMLMFCQLYDNDKHDHDDKIDGW